MNTRYQNINNNNERSLVSFVESGKKPVRPNVQLGQTLVIDGAEYMVNGCSSGTDYKLFVNLNSSGGGRWTHLIEVASFNSITPEILDKGLRGSPWRVK